jgi:hypothetical protein
MVRAEMGRLAFFAHDECAQSRSFCDSSVSSGRLA